MSLRRIRPYRGSFFSHNTTEDLEKRCEQDLLDLQQHCEKSVPYKLHTIGHLYTTSSSTSSPQWIRVPAEISSAEEELLSKAKRVAAFYSKRELHGIRYGRAVKQIYALKFSRRHPFVMAAWFKAVCRGGTQWRRQPPGFEEDHAQCFRRCVSSLLVLLHHLPGGVSTGTNHHKASTCCQEQQVPELQDQPMDIQESRKRLGPS